MIGFPPPAGHSSLVLPPQYPSSTGPVPSPASNSGATPYPSTPVVPNPASRAIVVLPQYPSLPGAPLSIAQAMLLLLPCRTLATQCYTKHHKRLFLEDNLLCSDIKAELWLAHTHPGKARQTHHGQTPLLLVMPLTITLP